MDPEEEQPTGTQWESPEAAFRDFMNLDDDFGSSYDDSLSKLLDHGRGRKVTRRSRKAPGHFIDPRTGDIIPVDDDDDYGSQEFGAGTRDDGRRPQKYREDEDGNYMIVPRTMGRGFINQRTSPERSPRSDLQRQLRETNPIGRTNEAIEEYFANFRGSDDSRAQERSKPSPGSGTSTSTSTTPIQRLTPQFESPPNMKATRRADTTNALMKNILENPGGFKGEEEASVESVTASTARFSFSATYKESPDDIKKRLDFKNLEENASLGIKKSPVGVDPALLTRRLKEYTSEGDSRQKMKKMAEKYVQLKEQPSVQAGTDNLYNLHTNDTFWGLSSSHQQTNYEKYDRRRSLESKSKKKTFSLSEEDFPPL